MNRIEYTLTAEDLLQLQLYYSAISPHQTKQRTRYRARVPVVYLILALLLLLVRMYVVATLFTLFAVVWWVFSPRWLRRRYRKSFEKHIAETCGDELPRTTVLELTPDGVHSTSTVGEARLRYDAVDRVVENDGYTYVFFGKGTALVLPHDRIGQESLVAFIEELQRKRPPGEPQARTISDSRASTE